MLTFIIHNTPPTTMTPVTPRDPATFRSQFIVAWFAVRPTSGHLRDGFGRLDLPHPGQRKHPHSDPHYGHSGQRNRGSSVRHYARDRRARRVSVAR